MLTDAKRKANEKYIAKSYKQIAVRWPNDFCARLHSAVEASGESLAGYMRKAIETRMDAEGIPVPPEDKQPQ